MFPKAKFSVFGIFIIIISVESNPFCNNWCPNPTSIEPLICCQLNSGQIGLGNEGSQGNQGSGGTQITQFYCPQVDCSKDSHASLKTCTTDDDCLRREICCDNPCDGNKKCFIGRTQVVQEEQEQRLLGCPFITSCRQWEQDNRNPTTCTTQNDCKRSETCCRIPCTGQTVCQRTQLTSVTGSRTSSTSGSTSFSSRSSSSSSSSRSSSSSSGSRLIPGTTFYVLNPGTDLSRTYSSYGTSFGTYGTGFGTGYNTGYGTGYGTSYGTGYGTGYGYGGGYSSNYASGCGGCASSCPETTNNCCC